MKHLYFTFCLLFIMSFNAVKETSAFEKKPLKIQNQTKYKPLKIKKLLKKL